MALSIPEVPACQDDIGTKSSLEKGKNSTQEEVQGGHVEGRLAAQHWKVMLIVLVIVYPGVCLTILQLYHCRLVEGQYYLTADFRIICFDDTWTRYAISGAVLGPTFILGTPLLFAGLLYWDRAALFDEEHPKHQLVAAKYGFIYQEYREEAWFFELVLMLQKLALTGLLIFVLPGSISQLALGPVDLTSSLNHPDHI